MGTLPERREGKIIRTPTGCQKAVSLRPAEADTVAWPVVFIGAVD